MAGARRSVCNFTVSALRHLLSFQPAILPRVNQVEVSQIPAAGLPFAHRARTLASLHSHHASLSRPSLRSCATCGLAGPLAISNRARQRHPLLPNWELLEFCNGHGIVLQAHSPLANGKEWLLQHAVLRRVATESA